MPELNYPSASEMLRNLAQIHVERDLLLEEGKFRVFRFAPPYVEGYEIWIVNEKGFLWEAVDSETAAMEYLQSEEAQLYNSKS